MTDAPTPAELDALKAVLVDALQINSLNDFVVSVDPVNPNDPDDFPMLCIEDRHGEQVAEFHADKLAQTIHAAVAAPLLARIAELERSRAWALNGFTDILGKILGPTPHKPTDGGPEL